MFDSLSYLFWIGISIVFYSYLGYGLLLFIIVKLKSLFSPGKTPEVDYTPSVSLLVTAYNEEECINEKIANSLNLNYPKDKLTLLFVTDGSDDKTPEIVNSYSDIIHLHDDERRGKMAAIERSMNFVDTEIVVYSDANTLLNKDAILNIVRHYVNPQVGAVAGEKRILAQEKDGASGAGEGIYWKYESLLKKWDSELYSVVGAAGELFSIRTELFETVPPDTIIEDFYMTLKIAQRGYRVIYEPESYAQEGPSASVNEELKRKIRIAAGGIQAIVRLKSLLNPFKYGLLTFQYISHRVLRWTLAPLSLFVIFITNLFLALQGTTFYKSLFIFQILFYLAAWIGYRLEKRDIKIKALFIPFYFCMMNYAVLKGMIRYFKGSQSVVWEKAKRAKHEIKV